MYKKIVLLFREKIRTREYIVTVHADEEMNADEFSIFDIEHCILTGVIKDRQRDKHTGELKYVVTGKSISGVKMNIVGKISSTGKLVIITVFTE